MRFELLTQEQLEALEEKSRARAEEEAERVFMRLYRMGELPSMAKLFKSIKEHQAKDRWWREKMPPLLGNWLAKKKWRDKPYE